jgi:AcrR family transcriptional regulator
MKAEKAKLPARRLGRPPNSRGEDRRQDILNAATRLFVEQQGTPATLEAVAAAAGVTRTAIYYYFPTRADLVAAVLMVKMDWTWWKRAIEESKLIPTFPGRVQRVLLECARSSEDVGVGVYFALVNVSQHDDEIRNAMRSYEVAIRGGVQRMVADSMADGLVPATTDCDEVSEAILGLIWCVASGYLLARSKRTLREIELATRFATGQIEDFQAATRRASRKRPAAGSAPVRQAPGGRPQGDARSPSARRRG